MKKKLLVFSTFCKFYVSGLGLCMENSRIITFFLNPSIAKLGPVKSGPWPGFHMDHSIPDPLASLF